MSSNPPSSKPASRKPNDPIVLEETSITHIKDYCLPTPCPVRAVLRLVPRIERSIDSDVLPRLLLESKFDEPFCISLKNGGIIRVMMRKPWDPNIISEQGFKGSLLLLESPYSIVAPDDMLLVSVQFSVLNFQEFYGNGVAKLEHDGWRIDITATPSLSDDLKILKQDGGYAVTHEGSVKRSDGTAFSIKDVVDLLDGLQTFLSFARGAACGLTLVKGVDKRNVERVIVWGTIGDVQPWEGQPNRGYSWMGMNDLSQAFPGFMRLYEHDRWKDTLRHVINWYTIANNAWLDVDIVLAQVALESLSYTINAGKKEGFAKSLKRTLKQVGIDDGIPQECKALSVFAESINNNVAKKELETIRNGPTAIAWVRNGIVHADKRLDGVTPDVKWEASALSLWYIESILLRKFECHGQHSNRLEENRFFWVGSDQDTAT